MPTDLATALQDAIFDALNVAEVIAHGDVVQHVDEPGPNDVFKPLTVIADIQLTPAGGKDGGLDQASFTILTYRREPRRVALYAQMKAVRDAIEGVQLSAAGAEFSIPVMESQTDGRLEDGQTYEGTQIFGLFVQPA